MATGSAHDSSAYMKVPPPPYPGLEPQGYQGQYPGPPLSPVQQFGPVDNPPQPEVIYVVASPPPLVLVRSLGSSPSTIGCPHCNRNVLTIVTPVNGSFTWLSFGLLCIFGCWFGCCLIPFCADGCKDMEHHCPNCNALLGTYRRM